MLRKVLSVFEYRVLRKVFSVFEYRVLRKVLCVFEYRVLRKVLSVFEYRVLRKVFGRQRETIRGDWKVACGENYDCSPRQTLLWCSSQGG